MTSGLSTIGMVLKSRAWEGAGPEGVTPTQAQALESLRERPASLGVLAARLGASTATASNAVSALVHKGLVVKEPGSDKRSITLRLTESGASMADRTSAWPDFLSRAVETLDPGEQTAMLRSLVKVIRTLQHNGDIPPQRICLTCRHFHPHLHAGSAEPHHCAYLNEPFGDRHLRLDCAEQVDASPEQQRRAWQRFVSQQTRPAGT
ncbi:MarR family winged helix-turn-helix transcriptional regulator [Nonomuraea indica]|uniref:MarR family winged helix-turn-helix transcriptional regulator n=1 Tax=Nonomuraea indica TaxID=1581193 RepID=UPI001C5F4B2B|nr:MarR family winged helix-turn-helix transcriptional regulator [Nonomuraea indica]